MRRKINILVIVILILFGFTGCMGVSDLGHSSDAQAAITTGTEQPNQNNQGSVQNTSKVYTCPMHPEVLSDMPGNCPKCGMELVVQNSANSHEPMKMGCMSMMQPNKHKSHIGMYLGGGGMMVGMMILMVLRFL